MDNFTHGLISILIGALIFHPYGIEWVFFIAAISILPDLDIIIHYIHKEKKYYYLLHRHGSHSFFVSIVLSFITGIVFAIITGFSFIIAWVICFFFYSLHIVMDLFSTSEIPIFYPFSKKEHHFCVTRPWDGFVMLFSIFVIILYIIFFFLAPSLFFSDILVSIILGIFVLYFVYRSLTKMWITPKLLEYQHFVSGVMPFVYLIYEQKHIETFYEEKKIENVIAFRLIKKYQFTSKSKILVEKHIEIGSIEMEYYERALKLSFKLRYFTKWEGIVPIIQDNENSIIIILFLAESYFKNVGYYLKVTFDKNTNEIIDYYDGYNVIMFGKKDSIQKVETFLKYL